MGSGKAAGGLFGREHPDHPATERVAIAAAVLLSTVEGMVMLGVVLAVEAFAAMCLIVALAIIVLVVNVRDARRG